MEILWREGKATADRIRLSLEPRRQLKDATVRTILRRLEEKGYARHDEEGRAFVYSPRVGQENVAARALRQIIDTFFGGDVEQMVVGMVESEVIDREELKRLAARLEKEQDNERLG
jgi:predicted transcriptional regulator